MAWKHSIACAWHDGEPCTCKDDSHAASRCADLIEGLLDVYTREGVGVWLTGAHRLLDGRTPADVLRDADGLDRIEALLDQLRSGAFV